MKNIFIEDSRISSFIEHLAFEIQGSAQNIEIQNLYIVGIGESGLKVAAEVCGTLLKQSAFDTYLVAVDRLENSMQLIVSQTEQYPLTAFPFQEKSAVVLVDGVARTGKTLLQTYSEFVKGFPNLKIWSYALAVCQSSAFVPSWYGILYEDSAHVILSRNGGTPNTSLYERRSPGGPALALRLPRADDPEFFAENPQSMGRYTAFDRHFDHSTNSKIIYVLEWDSVPIGYIAFHLDGSTLWVDYILICDKHREVKKGAGQALLGYVENYARAASCTNIALWAIEGKKSWYEKHNFIPLGNAIAIGSAGQSESYVPMSMSLKSDMSHFF